MAEATKLGEKTVWAKMGGLRQRAACDLICTIIYRELSMAFCCRFERIGDEGDMLPASSAFLAASWSSASISSMCSRNLHARMCAREHACVYACVHKGAL